MPDLAPADSYRTCLVLLPDVRALHRQFAAGLRERYGRVPLAISARERTAPEPPAGRLATTMANAVALADSRGDHRQVARLRDSALGRPDAAAAPVTLVGALVYRAELAVTLGDPPAARSALARAAGVELTAEQRDQARESRAAAAELTADLR